MNDGSVNALSKTPDNQSIWSVSSSVATASSRNEDEISQVNKVVLHNGLPITEKEITTYGDINIQDSRRVHIGSRTFYEGPVTIQQFFQKKTSNRTIIPSSLKNNIEAENVQKQNQAPMHPLTKARIVLLKKFSRNTRVIKILGVILLLLLIIIVYLCFVESDASNSDLSTTQSYSSSTTESSASSPSPWDDYLPMISRSEWKAKEPNYERVKLEPPMYVIICHTDGPICESEDDCTRLVQRMQASDMSSGLKDIRYNFLVGGDRNIYEGRGWTAAGEHSPGFDNKSLSIAFIGSFEKDYPKRVQLRITVKLLEFAVKHQKVPVSYRLVGQRQVVANTTSPGHYLYKVIQVWDHWYPEPQAEPRTHSFHSFDKV